MKLWQRVLWFSLWVLIATAVFMVAAIAVRNHQKPPEKPFQHTDESFRKEWDSMGDDLDEVPEGSRRAVAGLPDPSLYPPVPIAKVSVEHGWARPRALVEGKVVLSARESDGDHHFVLEDDQGNKTVCEIVPELPLPNGFPKVGMTVYAWGITRWDGEHRWMEAAHPCMGWKEK